jgi:hypothetical protein
VELENTRHEWGKWGVGRVSRFHWRQKRLRFDERLIGSVSLTAFPAFRCSVNQTRESGAFEQDLEASRAGREPHPIRHMTGESVRIVWANMHGSASYRYLADTLWESYEILLNFGQVVVVFVRLASSLCLARKIKMCQSAMTYGTRCEIPSSQQPGA